MRQKMLFCCLSAGMLGYISNVSAQDVYVDLSVLDSLDSSVQTYSPSEPLFPVLPPQPKYKPTPKKVVKKASSKKSEPIVKVEVKEKVEIPAPVEVKTPAVEQHQPIPYVESTEPVVVVDVEPAPSQATTRPASSTSQDLQTVEDTNVENSQSENVTAAPITPVAQTEELSTSNESDLLVDDNNNEPVLESITFSGEAVELTDAQKAQVDKVIASFKDISQNKIAIYSYNLDDGVDSFKKKRLSLNRALEVRSYLMQKGHKNFSIKVLNVDSSSDKANTVEIEELE